MTKNTAQDAPATATREISALISEAFQTSNDFAMLTIMHGLNAHIDSESAKAVLDYLRDAPGTKDMFNV